MVVSIFSILDKNGRERFFEESFLLPNIKSDVFHVMLFLTMSNVNIDFQVQDLQWRFYITRDILLNTRKVELIGKKEFITAALDPEYEIFVVHVATLIVDSNDKVHLSKKAQIAHLKADETRTKVFSEYIDFTNIFSLKLVAKLSKYMRINDHAIELVDDR